MTKSKLLSLAKMLVLKGYSNYGFSQHVPKDFDCITIWHDNSHSITACYNGSIILYGFTDEEKRILKSNIRYIIHKMDK